MKKFFKWIGIILVFALLLGSAAVVLSSLRRSADKIEDTSGALGDSEISPIVPTPTISGVWRMNVEKKISHEEIDLERVNGTYGDFAFDAFWWSGDSIELTSGYSTEASQSQWPYDGSWQTEINYIDFGSEPQKVSEEFLAFWEGIAVKVECANFGIKPFYFEPGMTWIEWFDSKYYADSDFCNYENGAVLWFGSDLYVIEDNALSGRIVDGSGDYVKVYAKLVPGEIYQYPQT